MSWYRHGSFSCLLVLGLGLLASCSSSRPAQVPGPAGGTATPAVATAPGVTPGGVANTVEGYRLGAGDQIRLTVFRHVDLSGEFQLDGQGSFAMPLVGDIEGMGLTARQLEDRVEKRLKDDNYLVDPQVSVEVLNYRPFYIIGEVANPGSYPYVSGMNVVNAVALAGGYTYRADQDDITINRGGSNGQQLDVRADTEVLPGDIVTVPERWF